MVYPIRKNHKVGYLYIKDDYTVVCPSLPAKFDYIGESPIPWNTTSTDLVESSFRLFSIDEKVGLIDHNLKEVIPNNYKRIRPISDNYFAVEKDSMFVLIDRNNQVIDETRYQNICAADSPNKYPCLLYTSPSPRDATLSRMPSSA